MTESSVPKPRDLEEALDVIATLHEQLQRSQRENDLLRHRLDSLCRRMFGKKSEKVDPSQLRLAFEMLEGADTSSGVLELDSGENIPKIQVRGHGRKRSKGRRPLPADLPRERQVVDIDESEKTCSCGCVKEKIGEIVTEKLEYVPSSFFVRETVRPKYVCGRCHAGVSVASAPAQAVEKAIAGEGLLAHVVVSKYADHTPLHRLEGIFARHGVDIPRTTMTDWVGAVADAMSPVVEWMKDENVQTDYLQTDDTPMKVLAYRSTGYKGRLWVYLDPLNRQVVFDATQTHERDGPMKFLANFEGYLQADAYSGYDELYRTRAIVEVGCWSHGRRRFVDALATDSRAAIVIALVQKLYKIEREISELSFAERKEHRQQYSKPLLEQLDETRKELQATVLPKSPLGEAVGYISNQWTALSRFIEDGRLRIDNNNAEYQLRAVAVGRKNWLFAGSFEGARRAATLYSLIQSCRLVSIDPFLYIRDVLVRIATHPQRQIAELTPRMWAKRIAKKSAA